MIYRYYVFYNAFIPSLETSMAASKEYQMLIASHNLIA